MMILSEAVPRFQFTTSRKEDSISIARFQDYITQIPKTVGKNDREFT